MWEQILPMATETGIWAVLFVWLFFKQLKENKTREEKCQQLIETLSEKLQVIVEIKASVDEISEKIIDRNAVQKKQ